MNPEKIVEGITKELGVTLKAMANAKTVEEKISHSQIIKNLSEALGVFLHFSSDAIENDCEEE